MSLPRSVLVVDDDFDLREVVESILADAGLRVEWASNGREACEVLDTDAAPSLILLDLHMPELDGRQFRQVQLARPPWARVPVVVFSGIPGAREEAEALGAVDVLEKPCTPDALLRAVERHATGGERE
jgi:two-component system, chemotaxis family, chemotaxis protein CheY